MNKKEKRKLSFKNIELRAEIQGEKKYLMGIIPYNSRSVPMWGTTEIIASSAFNKTIADGTEVRALYNHDDSKVLGSTKNNTLILENTETGLLCRVELPSTTYADDAFEIVNRGDVKTMSFGFIPQKWDDLDNGKTRILREVQLLETSFCVAFPAYPETNSVSYMRGLEKNNIDIDQLNTILEKDVIIEEDKTKIRDVINKLNCLVEEAAEEPVATTPNNDTSEKETIELMIETEINT
jgi:HK97 family phage prohead protease